MTPPRRKGASKGQKSAKGKATTAAPKKGAKGKEGRQAAHAKEASTPRAESKRGAKILALIGRSKRATLADIQKATDW